MVVNDLFVEIEGKIILNKVSFKLNKESKVGLVGKNGSGKSTLLKSLLNSKNVNTNGETIGYLKQEIESTYLNYTIIDYIKSATGLLELEHKLSVLENDIDNNIEEYMLLLDKYIMLDGYNFDNNLKYIMSGLDLKKESTDIISVLSGGERIKVLLTLLLLENKDILLMDEPTNNLDLKAVEWLENYLMNSNKKMIIVSHDEVFLNKIVNKVFELDNGNLKIYNMSYSNYLTTKDDEYNKDYNEYLNKKEEKDKLKGELTNAKKWLNNGVSKNKNSDNDKLSNNYKKETTSTSKIKKITRELNDMEVPYFEEKEDMSIIFNFDNNKGNKKIFIKDLVCGYDKFTTKKLSIDIPYGTRIMISGSNGSGKTTLIKTIIGEIYKISGEIYIGNNVRFGYISQNSFSDTSKSITEYIIDDSKEINYNLMYTLMSKFNIKYEEKDKEYYKLSPGERTRVNLIKLALLKTNVLILDEVTNHLDKEALDLIYELITTYKGTIISISHNRKYNELLKADILVNMDEGIVGTLKLN